MHRNLFILPDGTEVFSGVGKVPTLSSVVYTQSVNTGADLDFACAFYSFVEAALIDTSGSFSLAAGDELAYYRVDDSGNRTLVGHFLLEAPTKPSANTYKFTAYDRMILLDKDLTEWLAALDGWPYTMQDLLSMVCMECGLELADGIVLINGDFMVMRFLQNVTGRKLVQWIAGANAAFAAITPAGLLTFDTYTDSGSLALDIKSLKLVDYSTAPIERVVVRRDEDDIGVAWPENSTGETYSILGNPLLTAFAAEDLVPYVQNIAARLIGISYTPAEVRVFDPEGTCKPGTFITVTDRNGRQYKTAVFSVTRSGSISTLKSTGNSSRTSSAAALDKDDIEIIQGRVARIRATLEEISTELEQTVITTESIRQEQSAMIQTVDSITSQVSVTERTVEELRTQTTVIAQRSDSLELSVTSIRTDLDAKADQEQVDEITEHFRFDENGLTISNSATGMGIGVSEQRVVFTGGDNPTTVIYPNEMHTTNIRVLERLDLGEFSFLPRTNGNLSFRYTGSS